MPLEKGGPGISVDTSNICRVIGADTPRPGDRGVSPSIHLNPKYTFGNFTVGKYSELANAAASRLPRNRARSTTRYLLPAAWASAEPTSSRRSATVLKKIRQSAFFFVTCKNSRTIYPGGSLGRGKVSKTPNGHVDVLIIDDIQFLSSKEGSPGGASAHLQYSLIKPTANWSFASDRPKGNPRNRVPSSSPSGVGG